MHVLVRRTLCPRSAILTTGCRFVGGRRYRLRPPQFHSSAALRRDQDDPTNTTGSASKAEVEAAADDASENSTSAPEVVEAEDVATERAARAKDANSSYGSAIRRSTRHRRPKEIPPVEIPEWFVRNNVRLHEELAAENGKLEVIQDAPETVVETTTEAATEPTTEATTETTTEESATPATPPEQAPDKVPDIALDAESLAAAPRYQLHQSIWKEVLANIRSGLSLPPSVYSENFAAQKVHVLLQCPRDGGIYFLDAVVEQAAREIGADLLRLDAQDIAEIGGKYLGEGPDQTPYSIRGLGYDAQRVVARQESEEGEEAAAESEEDVDADEEEGQQPARGYTTPLNIPGIPKIKAVVGTLEDLFRSGKFSVMRLPASGSGPGSSSMPASRGSSHLNDQWEDLKMAGMAAAILEAADVKTLKPQDEHPASSSNDQAPNTEAPLNNHIAASQGDETERPLIVQVRDFKEIQSTTNGGNVLQAILGHVRRRRKAGQAVLLIGTVSSSEFIPSVSRPGFRNLQSEHEDGPGRTIVVTPARSTSQDSLLAEDERRRFREINLRHLRDMLRQRMPASVQTSAMLSESDVRLDSSVEYSSGLEESVLPFDRVHRVVSTVLGLIGPGEELTPATIDTALQLLDSSDETKFQWAVEEAQTQKVLDEQSLAGTRSSASTKSETRMKRLRKNCNAHEKKLLSGVVNPGEMPAVTLKVRRCTTFADMLMIREHSDDVCGCPSATRHYHCA